MPTSNIYIYIYIYIYTHIHIHTHTHTHTLLIETLWYSQSAWAHMRHDVLLLKNVSSPATAMLMSELVGLRSSVVKRGNCTFSMSSGATFTYGTCTWTQNRTEKIEPCRTPLVRLLSQVNWMKEHCRRAFCLRYDAGLKSGCATESLHSHQTNYFHFMPKTNKN